MNKNDDDSKDAFVEYLARKMLNKALFGQILTSKFEEVADQFEIDIPILILFQESRHEVFIADQLYPGEGEIGIECGVDLMELSR